MRGFAANTEVMWISLKPVSMHFSANYVTNISYAQPAVQCC